MKKISMFLTVEEKVAIKRAVADAESKTSGEIVVLVVGRSMGFFSKLFRGLSYEGAVDRRATEEFLKLGIQQTRDRTGVLIMISFKERMVSIKADKDINDKVAAGTWEKSVALIVDGIKEGRQCEGICNAVRQIGQILAEHFPLKSDDVNELPDEVVIEE